MTTSPTIATLQEAQQRETFLTAYADSATMSRLSSEFSVFTNPALDHELILDGAFLEDDLPYLQELTGYDTSEWGSCYIVVSHDDMSDEDDPNELRIASARDTMLTVYVSGDIMSEIVRQFDVFTNPGNDDELIIDCVLLEDILPEIQEVTKCNTSEWNAAYVLFVRQ